MNTQRILKADSMRQAGQQVVFDFQDFNHHCNVQLQKAQDDANQLLGDAQKRAASIEKQAQEKGYQAGYSEGLKNAKLEIQERASALAKEAIDNGLTNRIRIVETLAESISEAKLKWLAHWERISIELCVSIAEKIVHAEIAQKPQIRAEMIRSLLEVVSAEERVVVRVHPEDADYFQNVKKDNSNPSPFHQIADYRPDPNLNPGDCVVEMEFGVLDGRIDTQLRRIQTELSPITESEG